MTDGTRGLRLAPQGDRDDPGYRRPGVLVVRVVSRRELERAVRTLEVIEGD